MLSLAFFIQHATDTRADQLCLSRFSIGSLIWLPCFITLPITSEIFWVLKSRVFCLQNSVNMHYLIDDQLWSLQPKWMSCKSRVSQETDCRFSALVAFCGSIHKFKNQCLCVYVWIHDETKLHHLFFREFPQRYPFSVMCEINLLIISSWIDVIP